MRSSEPLTRCLGLRVTDTVPRPLGCGAHLDEGVQRLAVHLQELRLDVQHVDLRPGDHHSDEDAVRGPQALNTHTYTDSDFAESDFPTPLVK